MVRRPFMPLIIILSIGLCLSCASDEEKIQKYLTSGDQYFSQEEYRSAEIEFKNAIQIDPNLVEAHLKLGETYLKLGNAREAFREFNAAAQIDPNNMDTQLKLATFLFLGKQDDLAREKVALILAANPQNPEALLLRGGLEERGQQYKEAAGTYQEVLRIDANRIGAYLGLARVQLHLDQPDAAEATLIKASQVEPQALEPRMALFQFYAGQGQLQKANQVIQNAIADHPDNAGLLIVQANFLARQNRLDEAEAALRQAIAVEPDSTRPYLTLAAFYEANKEPDKALAVYQQALAAHPDDSQLKVHLARFYLGQGRTGEAETAVRGCWRNDPTTPRPKCSKRNCSLRSRSLPRRLHYWIS